MTYTKEEIEKYLEILKVIKTNQKKKKIKNLDVVIVKAIVLLLNQVIIYVIPVGQLMVMYLVFTMLKIMIDYIFEKRVFIRENITMRKRLIKFLKE